MCVNDIYIYIYIYMYSYMYILHTHVCVCVWLLGMCVRKAVEGRKKGS